MRKYFFALLCIMCFAPLALHAKANKQTVVLSCNIHCQGCIDKIMKNIAFEKGVKDIVCDLPSKTVTVTYDANKTDVPALLTAFEKINKPAAVKEDANHQPSEDSRQPSSKTDAETAASTPY